MEDTGLKVLNDLARAFADLRTKKETRQAELETINNELELVQQQLIDLMLVEGNMQFKLEGVGLVYISVPPRPRIINKETFFRWLEDNNEAYIIKPTVHNKTLLSWYKQIKEKYEKDSKDIKEELKGMVEVFEKPQLNLRRE